MVPVGFLREQGLQIEVVGRDTGTTAPTATPTSTPVKEGAK